MIQNKIRKLGKRKFKIGDWVFKILSDINNFNAILYSQ